MKNILITGGSGFIGRDLQKYLRSRFNIFVPSHTELDLLKTEIVEKYISDHRIEIIINCAAYGVYGTKLQDLVSVNLRIFFNLVRNLDRTEKIIHLGSGAEYDRSRPIIKIKEEEFGKRIPKDDYGFYKYICSKYGETTEKVICLRLFGVYGKYDADFKFIPTTIAKNLSKQEIVIEQNTIMDYLLIDDLMPIIEHFILNKPKYKSYNVAPQDSIDLITICDIINKISDYKSKIRVLKKGLNNEFTADNARLRSEIPNLKFTDYQKGIKKLFNWHKENFKKIKGR